ncbi:hypothetical protein BDW69DRAFT_199945 [Aspergillus filifer]
MEDLLFRKIPKLRIIVCCQCQHAVHPKEVEAHLQAKHSMKPQERRAIAHAITRWPDVHTNGMQCRRDPQCQYIGTHIRTLRKHWQQVHGWTQQRQRGRVGAAEQAAGKAKLQQSFHRVAWQQVFPTRKNSHLVHIRSRDPEPDKPLAPANMREQIAADIKARATADEQEAASQAVEADELHDANPWLRMTQWARYLAEDKVDYQDLLDVVATPDPNLEDAVGRATRAVWDTMDQLARRSQHTMQQCGNGIRMAAISTMPNQTPYQPLRAYMDGKSIQDHVQPWQQILLFIIRTQTNWPWRKGKPGYTMTTRQRKTWQQLWQLARRNFTMSPLETACLEFCIKLLNQKIKVHEYKSPLVCAMAVLGRGKKTWLGPNSYPPMISRVLKEGSWTGDAADNKLGFIMEDKGFAERSEAMPFSPSSPPSSSPPSSSHAMPIGRIPRTQRMPFQAGVDWMVRKFMVHGQHGPVEVLLDWRTFGLKIHYNTTAPGHVTWMGQERLLYKEMDFTMGEFRGFVHGLPPLAGAFCRTSGRHGRWPAELGW